MKSIFSITLFHKEFKTLLIGMFIVTLILCFTLPYAHVSFVKTKAYLTERNNAPNIADEDKFTKEEILEFSGNKLITNIKRGNFIQLALALLFPLVIGISLLGSERKHNTMDMLVTMPYSRLQIIMSKVLAGLLIIILPYIIVYAITFIQHETIADVSAVYSLNQLSQWFFASITPLFLIFAVGVFVSTLVAPFMGSLLIGTIVSIFGIGFATILGSNLRFFTISSSALDSIYKVLFTLSPISYIFVKSPLDLLGNFHYSYNQILIFSFIFAILLLGLAIFLYKRNPLENNHELLLFQGLNPVFIAGMTICMALTLAPMLQASFGGGTFTLFIGHLIGGLAGFLLSRYYIKKVRASV
ncbi:ABC transporter permease subunit [Clostridium sp. 'deep sea']|uniref:ABC transporter permease subunit n=1 Tax=Clostridium sp. 'deep sea' TaxID=2779445 RepID=UPI0018967B5A|nr:ABC transporter permease subunit [Clostridium sp. 'deep sea']QOR34256.1 ABC transporter permease subunit [Clostridium sp. 'deep sea']